MEPPEPDFKLWTKRDFMNIIALLFQQIVINNNYYDDHPATLSLHTHYCGLHNFKTNVMLNDQ